MKGCGALPSLFLFVLIEVLGFSIVLPLLPYLIQQYGLGPTEAGLLQSSNALAQLIAVPFIGSLSDRWGRKPLLLLCISGTLVSFLILAQAQTVFWLFFSRILDGIIGGNISLAHAYISDVTDKSSRSQGMGLIGGAFGLGFTIGPALGGILVKYNPKFPSYLAAALSALNLIMVALFLEESLPPEKREKPETSKRGNVFLDLFDQIRKSISTPKMAKTMWLRFLNLTIFTCFESSFGFFNKFLGNDSKLAGYLLCWVGVMYSLAQAGGIKVLKKRTSEDTILRGSIITLLVFYLIIGVSKNFTILAISLAPLGLASGFANTLINTKVSNVVDSNVIGGVFGVSAALASMCRIIAPTVCGVMMAHIGVGVPFIFCSILCIYLYSEHRKLLSM